ALERRDCPTLNLVFVGGNLFIMGRPTSVTTAVGDGLKVQVTSAAGAVTVSEVQGGATIRNYGTYLVRKNLYLGLTDYDTDINIDANGQRLFANVIVNLGLGDRTPFNGALPTTTNPLNIYDGTGSSTASVAGNITV